MSSAITTPPAKISLPSTSKMSLHDRFTKLAKTRPPTTKSAVSAVSSVAASAVVKGIPALAGARASAKNRNLALQMATRPSVQAALKIKNKSIEQRLGTLKQVNSGQARPTKIYKPLNAATNVKARLSPQKGNMGIDPARLSLPANTRFGGEGRGGRGGRGGRRSLNNSLNTSDNIRRVGAGGGMGNKEGRRSLRGRVGATNALDTNVRRYNRIGTNVQRGRGGRGRGGGGRGNTRGNLAPRGNGAAPGGQPQPPKSRENLDMDLDQYMAKSKSHLDNDLDSYMAQSNQ